ncbi:MAG: hypothetical protein ACRDM0_21310 [Thermoleophilaceae bacterium]
MESVQTRRATKGRMEAPSELGRCATLAFAQTGRVYPGRRSTPAVEDLTLEIPAARSAS